MKKVYPRQTFLTRSRILKHVSVLLLTGLALWGIVLLSGCASDSQPTQGSTGKTFTLDASWTRLYHDLKSLKHDTDLVVRGTITGVASTITSQNGPVMTDFTFHVLRVVWDPHHLLQGTSLTLRQTGGVNNGTRYSVSDDPLFQSSEEAVLFLHEFSPGYYYVVGGPSGRFLVQGGSIKPINDEGVHLPPALSESSFYSQIQNA